MGSFGKSWKMGLWDRPGGLSYFAIARVGVGSEIEFGQVGGREGIILLKFG